MRDTGCGSLLQMEITGCPGGLQILLVGENGHQVSFPVDGPTPAVGGAASGLELVGSHPDTLSDTERHKFLRHARHLLQPGGRLSLPPGGRPFPRDGLDTMAWVTGFDARVDDVAGRAVLSKPARPADGPSLVSIVMPAYKSEFFAEALTSAQDQTWPHCEIVVCDDSPGGRIAAIVKAIPGPHPVRYIRNPGNIGGRANYLKCFAEARGRYVKYLNDDDLLHPDCCRRMAETLDRHPSVTLVTSHRQLIDAEGRLLADEVWNRRPVGTDSLIDGRALASLVLGKDMNIIGEPTTVMFRKIDMIDSLPHIMSYAGRSARRNGDMSIWTSLLSRGDAVYLTDSLSLFRQHAAQVQKDPNFRQDAVKAWFELKGLAERSGLLDEAYLTHAVDLTVGTDLAAGEALFTQGDLPAAVAVFEAALITDPTCARARGDLACALWELGLHGRGLFEGVLASAAEPANATVALNLRDMMAV